MPSRAFYDNVVVPLTLNLEGGLSVDPNDKGNWTGGEVNKGRLVGTKYGISAASYPELDIPSLTKEQAADIYFRDYWIKSGSDKLDEALAMMHFDSAVNNGKGAAAQFLSAAVGTGIAKLYRYAIARINLYTGLSLWNDRYGDGWGNRLARLFEDIALKGGVDERAALSLRSAAASFRALVKEPGIISDKLFREIATNILLVAIPIDEVPPEDPRSEGPWKVVIQIDMEDGEPFELVYPLAPDQHVVQRTAPDRRRHYMHIRREG